MTSKRWTIIALTLTFLVPVVGLGSDAACDMQVVAVVAPVVTVQQRGDRIGLNLFQLPGFHDPTTVMDVAGNGTEVAPVHRPGCDDDGNHVGQSHLK